jgi:hypothetical protein
MRSTTVKLTQILLAGGALLSPILPQGAAPARADAVSYSAQRRTIKACVLVSNATAQYGNNANGGPNNPVPHLFYALDGTSGYKPGGWTFANPLAPSTITPAMYARWSGRGAKTGDPAFNNGRPESQIFQVGAPLNKNIGAYWEVNLDTISDTDLQQFDVVFLPLQGGRPSNLGGASNGNTVIFDVQEREKLRHYVDNGGTIWLENDGSGNFNNSIAGQFIVNLRVAPSINNPGVTLIGAPFHPVVNYPYQLSNTDVFYVGQANGPFVTGPFFDPNSSEGTSVAPRILTPVLYTGGATTVYAGDYGAGHLLITGVGVASDINGALTGAQYGGVSGVAGGTNDGVISGNDFAALPPIDLKFAYNAVDWISSLPAPGANSHRTGSSAEILGFGLAPKWSVIPGVNGAPLNPGNAGAGAIVTRNMTFNVDGSNVLHAYNLNPGQSLNGLLATDNGLSDFGLGFPYDEIWNVKLPSPGTARYSTPSAYSVYGTNPIGSDGGDHVVIATTNTAGQTLVYHAFPRDAQGHLVSKPIQIFKYPAGNVGNGAGNTGVNGPRAYNLLPAPASAYADGVLFVPFYSVGLTGDTDHAWHVQALDLAASVDAGTPIDAFNMGNGVIPTTSTGFNPIVPGLSDLSGSLTAGYVKDASTGANDLVVYAPTQAASATYSHNGQSYEGQVTGLWFRTRNEPLQPTDTATSGVNYRFQPHVDRSWVPWYVPSNQPGIKQLNLEPVVHVIGRNIATGQIVSTADYPYSPTSTVFSISFGSNAPNDSPKAPPAQRYMEVDFAVGQGIPTPNYNNNGIAYTVSVDYAVNWPGDAINGATMTGADMNLIASHRTYVLYPGTQSNTNAGSTQGTHYLNGGVALSGDSILFATNPNNPLTKDGLSDALSGAAMPDRIYSVQDQYSAQTLTVQGLVSAGPITNWMWAPTYAENFNGSQIKARLVNNDSFGSGSPTGQVVDGKTSGSSTSSFSIVGQPVVSNGVVYVVANAQMNGSSPFRATIILALSAHPNNTVSFPNPIPNTLAGTVRPNRIVVQQPDLVRSTSESPVFLQLFPGTNYTLNLDTDPTGAQIIRGITIINARSAQGQDAFNAALPIFVTDGSGQRQVIYNPSTNYGPLDNLLWYLVIPQQAGFAGAGGITVPDPTLVNIGQAVSGPSVFGHTLYYNAMAQHQPTSTNPGTVINQIVAVDLNGAGTDGRMFAPDGTPRVHVLNTLTNPKDGTKYASFSPAINPPLATANSVGLGTPEGMVALDNRLTLVADSSRLIELDALGGPIWSLDGTVDPSLVGGPANSSGAITNTHVPFDRPSLAHIVSPNIFLVADTGNNRIVQCDFGGTVLNQIHTVNNDLGILRPGDPITLSAPTDVQTYLDAAYYKSQIQLVSPITGVTYTFNGLYTATHYIIADSGNYRAIEVVDATNLSTGQPVVLTSNNPNYPNVTLTHQVIFVTTSLAEQTRTSGIERYSSSWTPRIRLSN